MKYIHITCRTHGGVFKVPGGRRGRRPVRCGGTNSRGETIPTCTRYEEYHKADRAEAAKHQPTAAPAAMEPRPKLKNTKRDLRVSVVQEAPVTSVVNISLPHAMQAKEKLIEKGWNAKGRAWSEDDHLMAEVTADRDEEHILMVWRDGELITQDYSLWKNGHTPESNGRPKTALGFDPQELPDQELMRVISGQSVTWWNKLGSREESGVINGNKAQITHTYIGGRADENPGERVITFVDHTGGGYRSFHVSALMKVG